MGNAPYIPNPENQKRGKQNRAEGKAFEALLDKSFEYFNSKGFCQIDKTPEPMKIIKRMPGGKFVACFLKKAQPDYKGVIKGGRSVVYEAKYTSQGRAEQSIVNDVQTAYMDKAFSLGARCFVILGFATGSSYCIPWNIWSDMKKYYGRKYVTEDDIQKYRMIEFGGSPCAACTECSDDCVFYFIPTCETCQNTKCFLCNADYGGCAIDFEKKCGASTCFEKGEHHD